MPATAKSLGIDQWSVEDRLRLIDEIWEGIEDMSDETPVSEAHKAILDERLAAHAANPHDVVSWEVVQARLQAKYGT